MAAQKRVQGRQLCTAENCLGSELIVLLGVSMKKKNSLHRDHVGVIFLCSLLANSKSWHRCKSRITISRITIIVKAACG